ncbi:hypothetical protein [Sphingopyxis lindanitolerans]|uniref:hypothetical protein n=1 Tax=Sphingopyxis lindanitolerans TaxID=2054227 RepID=UPI0011B291E8|nr:hypothetical protein [Sphingopyxis lindanitolerans]
MISIFFFAASAFSDPTNAMVSTDAATDREESYFERRIGSDRFDRLRLQADQRCKKSFSPDECRAAFLAGNYSMFGMDACLERAGQKFLGEHGGTSTSGAQNEMARRCASAIDLCRSNWQRFYMLSGPELKSLDERQSRIVQANLDLMCENEAIK